MLITPPNLANLFAGFKTAFNKGLESTESTYLKLAMEVPSDGREETYPWLGQWPGLREWVGERILNNLVLHGFTIKNRDFESTVEIPRNDIADDKYAVFTPMFTNMGAQTKRHPDVMVYELLSRGFEEKGYDGAPFFSAAHPGKNAAGQAATHSNIQDGDGPAWFLIDGSKPLKPLVFQRREDYRFTRMDADNTENVFLHNRCIYGVNGRVNAGFALWQLAFGSKAPLTAENYEAARAAMKGVRSDGDGRKLGVSPTLLVVPDELEGAGLRLINNDTRTVTVGTAPNETTVAAANEWKGTAELIVSPFL